MLIERVDRVDIWSTQSKITHMLNEALSELIATVRSRVITVQIIHIKWIFDQIKPSDLNLTIKIRRRFISNKTQSQPSIAMNTQDRWLRLISVFIKTVLLAGRRCSRSLAKFSLFRESFRAPFVPVRSQLDFASFECINFTFNRKTREKLSLEHQTSSSEFWNEKP